MRCLRRLGNHPRILVSRAESAPPADESAHVMALTVFPIGDSAKTGPLNFVVSEARAQHTKQTVPISFWVISVTVVKIWCSIHAAVQ